MTQMQRILMGALWLLGCSRLFAGGACLFPDLFWDESAQAGSYHVQIAEDAEFKNVVADETVEIARYVPPKALKSGQTYYWRTSADAGPWAPAQSFTVADYEKYIVSVWASNSVEEVFAKVADAQAHAPATVRLMEDVEWSSEELFVLDMAGLTNIWFDGNSKNITVTSPLAGLFQVKRSENVVFSDFTVDYNPLPYVLCEVVEQNMADNQLVVRTVHNEANPSPEINDPRMLSATRPHMRQISMDVPGSVKFGSDTYVHVGKQTYSHSFEKDGQLLHVIQLNAAYYSADQFPVGEYMIRVARMGHGVNILRAEASNHVVFHGVTTYASPAQFVNSVDGSGLIVQDCNVAVKEGRYNSVVADVVYVRRNDIGPWIRNNRFEGNGDDCINLHGVEADITAKKGKCTLELKGSLARRFDPGDQVAIWTYATNDKPIYTTVVSTDADKRTVTFRDPVGEITLGNKAKHLNTGVFNLTKSDPHFYIEGNTIMNGGRYGIILAARDGVILNNRIEHCASSAIRIGLFHNEGLGTSNVRIHNNLFKNCGYRADFFNSHEGVVQIGTYAADYVAPKITQRLHHNIEFIGNTIEGWSSVAARIEDCSDVIFRENLIIAGEATEFPAQAASNVVFVVGNASNITICGNRLNDPRAYTDYMQKSSEVDGLTIDPEKPTCGECCR